MSEHNIAGLIFKTNLEKYPEIFTINDEELTKKINRTIQSAQALAEQNTIARNKKTDEAAKIVGKPTIALTEYNDLRKQLFDVQQRARGTEQHVNNTMGTIRLLEERINGLRKRLKDADNPLAENKLKHQISLLETELIEFRSELSNARLYNSRAVTALKTFPHHDRIAELKKELSL
jgi:predicted  nucleic acid-binding Zn-ribbon protein